METDKDLIQELKKRIWDLERNLQHAIHNGDVSSVPGDVDMLAGDFCKAQSQFEPLKKSGESNRGPYSTLDDIAEATHEALNSNGLTVFVYRKEIKSAPFLVARLQHSSGQSFESSTRVPHKDFPTGQEAQEIQGVISRLTRYLIKDLLGVMKEDDGDSPTVPKGSPNLPLSGGVTENQLKLVKKIVSSNASLEAETLEALKIPSLDAMTKQEASDFISKHKGW
jgi:hypothetical protein